MAHAVNTHDFQITTVIKKHGAYSAVTLSQMPFARFVLHIEEGPQPETDRRPENSRTTTDNRANEVGGNDSTSSPLRALIVPIHINVDALRYCPECTPKTSDHLESGDPVSTSFSTLFAFWLSEHVAASANSPSA
jgi:hypothetical protein